MILFAVSFGIGSIIYAIKGDTQLELFYATVAIQAAIGWRIVKEVKR